MSNKKITQLPAKTTQINSGDLFELAEVQPGGTFVSKKLSGSQLISALPVGPQGAQGVAGPQGPVGPQGPIGPAGLTWQGTWSSSTAYHPNDIVYYNGASYFCIAGVGPTIETPQDDITNWSPLAIQGPVGPIGPVGAQGPAGSQGSIGPAGPQGIQGVPGPVGPQGATGPMGPQGPVSAGSFTHWIGEKYQGGTIAHLWKDSAGVEHGLILCENNVGMDAGGIIQYQGPLTPSVQWIGWANEAASSTDGQANTAAIVAQFGSSNPYYAAYACDQLVYGGYSDWYLPSVHEMTAIKQNSFAINLAIQALGSGNEINIDSNYWTSTVYSSSSGLLLFGFYTTVSWASFPNQNFVRAIRKF